MCSLNCVSFRGNNYNTGYNLRQAEPGATQAVNFKAGYDVYECSEPKKKTSPLLVIGGILGLAALAIAGLGYAHKTDILSRIKNEKIKGFLEKGNPLLEKCHEWCAWTKDKGGKCLDTVKGWFSKKA